MKITLQRHSSMNGCTIGDVSIDGMWECYSCEDEIREVVGQPVSQWKIDGKTAIPAGTYKVITDFSHHFQKILPHVLNVPGFEGIRIHGGNTAADTEGCILLGMGKTSASVLNSQMAMNMVQPLIQSALDANREVTLEILNP